MIGKWNCGPCVAAMFVVFVAADRASAATVPTTMAPLAQYLIADRNAEIAMARSAAPASLSKDAHRPGAGQHGYEVAIKGSNGFTCLVERSWMAPFDTPEFWNPRIRGPICYNPPAVRTVLSYTVKRTQLALAGESKDKMVADIQSALAKHELKAPEPSAMSYMLSRQNYLGDAVHAWHPHLMFHIPKPDGAKTGDGASWGKLAPLAGDAEYRLCPDAGTRDDLHDRRRHLVGRHTGHADGDAGAWRWQVSEQDA